MSRLVKEDPNIVSIKSFDLNILNQRAQKCFLCFYKLIKKLCLLISINRGTIFGAQISIGTIYFTEDTN